MDNHSLRSPERWRPSKACSHRSTIWREDSVSCNPSSQSSRTPSRPSKRSSMSEVWTRNELLHQVNRVTEKLTTEPAHITSESSMVNILNVVIYK